jgi:carboxypeptidase C (cathepsin A)
MKHTKHWLITILSILFFTLNSFAQRPDKGMSPQMRKDSIENNQVMKMDYKVTRQASVTINGKIVPYQVTASTTPVWDDNGETIAGVFSVFYERTDTKDKSTRPLVFSFNGGPGSASLWMMLGYTGPRLLNIDPEGYPILPPGLKDNHNSILDVADIVYVDPVNTGFSRPISEHIKKSKFFGVNADIKYLANWISSFVTREKRWASPQFLIGESYGTVRVSGLALKLQQSSWIYPLGVILVSPTTLGINREGPVSDALRLPYFAATAWYHKALDKKYLDQKLADFLPQVEHFTLYDLLPAIAQGGSLPTDKREAIIRQFSAYSGLSQEAIRNYNMQVPVGFYWKELLRTRGQTLGRLDSRYIGVDTKDAGNYPEYNAEFVAWMQSFTPAINLYLRGELGFETNLTYNVFGNVYPWDNENDNTGNDLRSAMAQNPYLHVMVQSGYFDGACDYFNAKYNLWQLDENNRVSDRLSWKGYPSGHMMYLRQDDLKNATEDVRQFILNAMSAANKPAKYGNQ